MANSFWNFIKGIRLKGETSDPSDNQNGSMWYNSTSNRLKGYFESAVREVTTNNQSQTLTNKTFDADANTLSNVDNADIKSGANIAHSKMAALTADRALQSSASGVVEPSSVTATELSYLSGADSNIQDQIDAGGGDLSTHIADTTTHGTTGNIVGTSDSQTLTNKTIDADANTISNIENADIKSGAAIARNKLASGSNNHVIINDGSGVMSSEAQLATSRGGTGVNSTATFPSSGVVVTEDASQTLTNKTINGASNTLTVRAANDITGQLPIANGGTGQSSQTAAFDALAPTTTNGDMIYHNGTDNVRLPIGAANQVVKVVGGIPTWATFSGGINYLSANPDAEANATTGWATYADAAGTAPVDGTGGSPSSTWTVSSSTPLRGTYSFLWTKSANNRQGEGVSYDFTIDTADRGKFLLGTCDFTVASGTYATGDMAWYIYDVTNATVIQATRYQIESVGVGLPIGRQFGFQTASNSSSYRLCIHTASTSASAYTLKFDNFRVGPQMDAVNGGATPTVQRLLSGSGTYTTPAGVKYLRVSMVGPGGGGGGSASTSNTNAGSGNTPTDHTTFSTFLTAGRGSGGGANSNRGGDGGTNTISAPAIQVISVAGSKGGNSGNNTASSASNPGGYGGPSAWGGSGSYTANAATNTGAGGAGAEGNNDGSGGGSGGYLVAIIPSPAASYSYVVGPAGTGGSNGTGGASGTNGGSGAIIVEEFYHEPSLGNDGSDGRVVATQLNGSATNLTTSTPTIVFSGASPDTHSSFDGTSTWTCKVPGIYTFAMSVRTNSQGWSSNQILELYYNKNGAGNVVLGRTNTIAATYNAYTTGSVMLSMNAGDTMIFKGYSDVTTGMDLCRVEIARLAGPNQPGPSETVSASYTTSAGQSVASSNTVVVWGTKNWDSHNAMNTSTGVYTAPISGVYQVQVQLETTSVAHTAGGFFSPRFVINGSNANYVGIKYFEASVTGNVAAGGVMDVRLLAGQTFAIAASHSNITSPSLNTNTEVTWMSIKRIGNYV